jgi:hypothetical protein
MASQVQSALEVSLERVENLDDLLTTTRHMFE